ncbi:dihydroorotase [Paracoccus suum]|uniref:Dihydroorotase n=1 Tax=Paracoccus suum TaxID=2259340 RepID=A0A344PGD6_9RHOB|nr:dihydroorotase family protein [Paracoccus suum]AXC48441.1 dihydroorotase [Paracoccus suum]
MSVDLAINGGTVLTPEGLRPVTVLVRDGRVAGLAGPEEAVPAAEVIDAAGLHVLPGVIDIHCHIRSPAYPQRGSVASETAAAAAGGITTVFEMPITDPCCNSPERLRLRRDHFAPSAHVDFALYAAPATLTEAAFEALAEAGAIGLKIFTTPAPPGREAEFAGLSWPDAADQLRVLQLAARVGLPVVVHAEHPELLARAAANAASLDAARATTHEAGRPALAEVLALAQLLTLNIAAGARLHIAHVTSAAAVDMLRRFAGSSDFSAETCPHYLLHTIEDIERIGVCAKINPPVRTAADREALWAAVADGTLGHVASDHAAFAPAEKGAVEGNFLTAPPGHPGLDTMLPSMLDAVAGGRMDLASMMDRLSGAGARRFGLADKGKIAVGAAADLILADLGAETHVTEAGLQTAARAIARLSHGARLRGRLTRTLVAGRSAWDGAHTGPAGTGRFVSPRTLHGGSQ